VGKRRRQAQAMEEVGRPGEQWRCAGGRRGGGE